MVLTLVEDFLLSFGRQVARRPERSKRPHLCAKIDFHDRELQDFSPPLISVLIDQVAVRYNHSKWVVFTATERAYQPPPSPTPATHLRG